MLIVEQAIETPEERRPRRKVGRPRLKSFRRVRGPPARDTTELQVDDNDDVNSLDDEDIQEGQPLPAEPPKYRSFERPGALQVAIQQQIDKVTPYGPLDKPRLLDEEFENEKGSTPNTIVEGTSASPDEHTPDEMSTFKDLPSLNFFTGLLSSASKDSVACLIKTPEQIGSR